MRQSLLPQYFMHAAMLLGVSSLSACTENGSPSERVRAFCDGIRTGEDIADVELRYSEFHLQIGGVAPVLGARSAESVPEKDRHKITGILAEPSGSMGKERPVCAVYYNDSFLTGDGKVVHKEFMADWAHRY